jgi:oligosaccharide repeat unit polymerase
LKFRTVVRAIAVPVIVVVFFGVLGDIRSGAENFRALAQATDQYPAWLPSGFLWTYMYVTTPLNNLVNTFATVRPIGDFTMPNTFSALIPTATRKLLGLSIDNSTWQGNLITEAFNVTTAYAGPLQDLGIAGIVAFSGFVGFLSEMFWLKRGLRNDLIYAVLGQCLFLTIFANHFLALPIIFQVVWCYFLFGRSIRVVPSSSPAVSAYGT